ncbi:hypothetical protein F2Q68_00006040 [Brassica cretica]|uniref:Uncharacterized protein n=1 Tax=Brassica cretica TaxID=69181 RepID=A0A8S9J997_BRACR|nr:hypothetical protein F2Q68_00006040 [Brassica cretica]
MTRTTGDLPKKFGAPKKGLIDGGDASTSNNKNGQAQAKKKVDKERMWLLRLRILIIVRAELRGRERGTYLGESEDWRKPHETAAGLCVRTGPLGSIFADGTRPRYWPRVMGETKRFLWPISADRYATRETAAAFGRQQAVDSTGTRR